MRGGSLRRAALGVALLSACARQADDVLLGALATGLRVEVVASELANPVFLTAPQGDDRVFIVEQRGVIRVLRDGAMLAEPFLDLTAQVRSGGERGLLSLAFHPRYAETGLFFVNYTDAQGATRVVRYRVSADPDVADPATAATVLRVDQPYANHNGGLVRFGPDGMLYVGMGDGGAGGDPLGAGQDLGTPLGALLRLDVDAAEPYAVPPDNPFVGRQGAREEIWASGLRNPWRFAFDAQSRQLFIADVGQNAWEEINVVPADAAGLNYGWNTMEASHCYARPLCNREGLVLPAVEYSHEGGGCSVIGGDVYRGTALRNLGGQYFYSDYCAGWLRSFRVENGQVTDHRQWDVERLGSVVSFGTDGHGELYVLSQNGSVYRLVDGAEQGHAPPS